MMRERPGGSLPLSPRNRCARAHPVAPVREWLAGGAVLGLSGCTGVQSALSPAGEEAARISVLFWWMTGGALVIWAAVVMLALYYGRRDAAAPSER